jgi:hypothetical protein
MNLQTVVVAFFTVCAFLNPTVEGVNDPSPYAPECQAWKNVTDRVTVKLRDHPNVSCAVNPPCTGFECNGKLKIETIEETFRFGMSFLPCTDPLKFEVVADVPGYPFNFTLEVGKRQTINRSMPVPGGTRSWGPVSLETNLNILLISTISSDGLQLITFETNVTIKMTPPATVQTHVLIPRVTVPFPYCSGPPSVFSEPVTSSQAPDYSWTGVNCTYLAMDKNCKDEKQMCTASGRCSCLRGLFWHADSQQCSDDIPPKSSKTDVWIIVAATVSAVVVVAGIVIISVHKYRRNRERYGQHSLLVDRENDTELDDPDPPMLPA